MSSSSVDKKLKEKYSTFYSENTDKWRYLGAIQKVENIIGLCKNQKFKRVLEVGAGDGSILEILNSNHFCDELYAVEISESGIEKIKNRNLDKLKEVKLFDGYKLPFEDNYFDLIILSHVLEHVEHPRTLLREIARVSEFQIIEVPRDYKFNIDKRIDKLLSYGHIWVFTPTLLRFLLKSENFEIIKDKMSFSSKEIIALSLFPDKNFFGKIKLNLFILLRTIFFTIVSVSRKETMINAYTVLTKKAK